MVDIREIPRAYVRTTLRALRTPVDLSAAVAKRGGEDGRPWPPSVVFTTIEGGIKKAVGSLIRDDRLVEEGELNQAAAKEQRQALLLGVVAESRRGRAQERFEERQEQLVDALEAVHERTEAEKRAAERAAGARRRKLASKAQKLAETDARLEADAQDLLEHQDRVTRAPQIQRERRAIAEERRAVEKEAAVAELDAKIEQSKKERKQGSGNGPAGA